MFIIICAFVVYLVQNILKYSTDVLEDLNAAWTTGFLTCSYLILSSKLI